MDERLKFVARLLDGEKMAVLCREFEISRKTGYKIYSRYKDCGVEGLTDRSRRPYRHARQLPFQIEKAIVQRYESAQAAELDTRGTVNRLLLITFVLALVAVGGLSLMIGRSISNAIVAMVKSMKRLATGDATVEIPSVGRQDDATEGVASFLDRRPPKFGLSKHIPIPQADRGWHADE